MFSPTGLFSKIPCPLQNQCELSNCVFLHEEDPAQPAWRQIPVDELERQSQILRAPNKRLKLSQTSNRSKGPNVHGFPVSTPPTPPDDISVPDVGQRDPPSEHEAVSTISVAARPISPPPLKRATLKSPTATKGNPVKSAVKKENESLNPRMMPSAPAAHSSRSIYLRKLHEILTRLNNLGGDDEETRITKLSDARLVTLALNEEEKLARENPTVYANVIKLRMVTLSKMTIEQWRTARQEMMADSAATSKPPGNPSKENSIDTGLTVAEEIQILPYLFADSTTQQRYGFITSPPTDDEIDAAREGVDGAMGWEQCERCKSRFQVFPDRRDDGSLTSGGRCTYHHGRIAYPEIRGSMDKILTCCNQPLGSSAGCTTSDTHVFSIHDGKRLASILQFEGTPENPDPQPAVCFDCEMGFTTNGMEMIRLTAISWPQGKGLLDVLVKPLGTILDFNTRFSGVRAQDFANATQYVGPSNGSSDKAELQVVDSPLTARKLLFELISPSTPLIGHSVENDLNVTRVVHPSIVDTAILYPHKAGPPRRLALKRLTKDILLRDIQSNASGHDSKEDALAAGDLARIKVAKKWRQMKAEGWKFEDGQLHSPAVDIVGSARSQQQQKVPLKRTQNQTCDSRSS